MIDHRKITLSGIMEEAFATAESKGFHSVGKTFGDDIALMHAELSEMLEAHRKSNGDLPCDKVPEITCVEEEAADLLIRLADFCMIHNIRLPYAVLKKMEYNTGRPYLHGKRY